MILSEEGRVMHCKRQQRKDSGTLSSRPPEGGTDGAEMGEWPPRPWGQDSSWGSLKQPTPQRTPFCPAPVKELLSGKIETEKQINRKKNRWSSKCFH